MLEIWHTLESLWQKIGRLFGVQSRPTMALSPCRVTEARATVYRRGNSIDY